MKPEKRNGDELRISRERSWRGEFNNPRSPLGIIQDSLSLSKFFMMKQYKWGILAPGKMSAKFTIGLKLLDNAELYAVGSRDIGRSEKFSKEHGFKKYYGSYEEL
ncbi:MAG TPA: hypothetical protein VMW32_10515, partial [Bacteroidales bacterium]|nr:hypothetical protein [Bacteroidales bacterium]